MNDKSTVMHLFLAVVVLTNTALPTAVGSERITREKVLSIVNRVVKGQPAYRSWPIFPSRADDSTIQPNTALDRYRREYYLKRLGLPVHGRWVSTYVNPIAYNFLRKAIKKPPENGTLKLPIGSIIVKENFRTEIDFKAFNNPDTDILPAGGPLPRPAVLTILYKVGKGFCQTQRRSNGTDCFGGGWLWIYQGLNPLSRAFDPFIDPENFCINCHAPAYESDYLRSLQSQRRSFTGPEQPFTRAAGQEAPAVDVCENLVTASADLPGDVPLDPATIVNAQKMFDCLSWKSFVALNWPADSHHRGQPNPTITEVNDPGFLSGPRVWQTYKETYEVFQPTDLGWNPSEQPWNAPQPRPEGEGCRADMPIVSMISKSQSNRAVSVGNETGQAFAGSFGTLKDQNNHLVRYEVRFNRDEFEYILKTGSAITKNLRPSGPQKPDLPDNRRGSYGGSIEVKAAWREMCTENCFPAPDNQQEYYTQKVLVYYPESPSEKAHCESKTMGLIALHIAHKTHFAPQWIWSTFSFKDNVPDANDPHARATAFFNPARAASSADQCWEKPFLISPENCPNVELNRFPKPAGFKGTWPGTDLPNQITRLQPVQGSGLNETFAKLLASTPFKNYILLNTQWPFNGRNNAGAVNSFNCTENSLGSNCFTMIPRYLRNPVVESYMTTYNYQRQQYSNRSCMGCHVAAGADASYIWLDGVEQVVPIQ
ncbi:MAG: hypothetical protein ACU843_09305 [Gammaproteobacteria bacterium]